jgi:hypothetical protein
MLWICHLFRIAAESKGSFAMKPVCTLLNGPEFAGLDAVVTFAGELIVLAGHLGRRGRRVELTSCDETPMGKGGRAECSGCDRSGQDRREDFPIVHFESPSTSISKAVHPPRWKEGCSPDNFAELDTIIRFRNLGFESGQGTALQTSIARPEHI